jgi:hypothetical protein
MELSLMGLGKPLGFTEEQPRGAAPSAQGGPLQARLQVSRLLPYAQCNCWVGQSCV